MPIICNATTWVPYWCAIATTCHQLRLLHFRYNLLGAGGMGLGGRNCAAIFYRRVLGGNLCHVTNSSESGVGASRHSERVCYDELIQREGAMPPVIEFVYTERFPCGRDNQNCMAFLNNTMPSRTPVFWSFDWPDSADIDTRDDPDDQPHGRKRGPDADDDYDKRRGAKRRRAQGTKDLKDYQRDIDYRGAVKQQSAAAGGVLANVLSCQMESAVMHWQRTGSLINPMPSADQWTKRAPSSR